MESANAQNNLALKYLAGEGVRKDLELSYMWSSIALALGKEEARENLDDGALAGRDPVFAG